MVTRHEFLAMLHEKLQPRGYLEVGVYSGDSLRLVHPGTPAIGIDPAPHLQGHFPGTTRVFAMTSDQFFEDIVTPEIRDPNMDLAHIDNILAAHLDLAFIDGMHLFEFALRDFLNIEQYANPRTVVVLDDVMPRNQHEAARTQCPGDWTGDVWKVPSLLGAYRRDLKLHWVDTEPTGTAVIYGFGQGGSKVDVFERVESLGLEGWEAVPDDVINRVQAIGPHEALELIALHQLTLETQEQS